MSNKLTKDQIKAKKTFHEKRAKFYAKKLKQFEKEEKKIGFKWYKKKKKNEYILQTRTT